MSLVAILETLLGEVEGLTYFLNQWRAITRSGGIFHID